MYKTTVEIYLHILNKRNNFPVTWCYTRLNSLNKYQDFEFTKIKFLVRHKFHKNLTINLYKTYIL